MCAATAWSFYVGYTATLWFVSQTVTKVSHRHFPKRKLYQRWFDNITLKSYEEPFNDEVEAKFKTELAKPGKHGRLFVTYASSILMGGWIYDHLKRFFCVEHDVSTAVKAVLPFRMGGWVPKSSIFVAKSLDEAADYSKFFDNEGLTARVFSDDMSCCYRSGNTKLLFDADISSCDAGNGPAMFYLLSMLMRLYGFGRFVNNQFLRLKAAITIRNPTNPKEFVKVRPKTIFQGSGCPETTLVNDVASLAISISFVCHIAIYNYKHRKDPPKSFNFGSNDVRAAILQKAAFAVGHKITIDFRSSVSQLQFLKYSFMQDDEGEWVNTRNLGAVLRNIGRVQGDVSARSLGLTPANFRKLTHSEAFDLHVAGVVKGLCNEPQNLILDALRERFTNANAKLSHEKHQDLYLKTNRSHHYLPVSSLQARYGGEEWEWVQLADKISKLRYGTTSFSTLMDGIMAVDYGL